MCQELGTMPPAHTYADVTATSTALYDRSSGDGNNQANSPSPDFSVEEDPEAIQQIFSLGDGSYDFFDVVEKLWDVQAKVDAVNTAISQFGRYGLNEFDIKLARQWSQLSTTTPLSKWPADIAPVYCNAQLELWICSLGGLMQLDHYVRREYMLKPHVVLSMNNEDEVRQGEPDRTQFFRQRDIVNPRFDGWDKTRIMESERTEFMRNFDQIWRRVASQVELFVRTRPPLTGSEPLPSFAGQPCRILVHCYGGCNRSGAAIACLLMYFCELTVEQAVFCLLRARGGNDYWHQRQYMIRALVYFDARAQALRYGRAIKRMDFPLPLLNRSGRWGIDLVCSVILKSMIEDNDHVPPAMILPQMEDLVFDGEQDMAIDLAEKTDETDDDDDAAAGADPMGAVIRRLCDRAFMNNWDTI